MRDASPRLLRTFGVVAAVTWTAVALVRPAAWMHGALLSLAAAAAAAALVLAIGRSSPLAPWPVRALLAPSHRVFVGGCALAAVGVSLWFARVGLREEPLSIDAGVYVFQARAMAHGHFGMPEPSPAQAFSEHFLFEGPDRRLYGVFPPGWPLAVVPFVWLGDPVLVGPAVAALLVIAQAALGRAIARAAIRSEDAASGEVATRASLLLSLPSYARAIETGDVASHAWVGVLAAAAVAAALGAPDATDATDAKDEPPRSAEGGPRGRRRPRGLRRTGLFVGACVGWAFAARMLDGLVIAGAVAGLLAWRPAGRRALGWAALGAAPWLALLAVEQRFATGAWLLPTQTEYFVRSDWPPNCHRLGFGPGVGCTAEHTSAVAVFGPDGYGLRAALAVTRERAGALGEDLFGFAPLALLAFAPLAVAASAADAVGVAFVLALTLAYALFYYGNAVHSGARHLFPAAPFAWLLASRGAAAAGRALARSLSRGTPVARLAGPLAARLEAAAVAMLLAAASVAASGPWSGRGQRARDYQSDRSELRRTLASRGIDRAILRSPDETAVAAAIDTWQDGADRLYVLDDGSGLVELRRAHPDLPLLLSFPGDDIGRLYMPATPRSLLVEWEREWPSFVRPDGLTARPERRDGASGGRVLLLTHARPGATVALPFDVAIDGEYALRLDSVSGPDEGEYAFALDGEALPHAHGYAPEARPARGDAVQRRLAAGRHELVARCLGKDDASTGYGARIDALVGDPVGGAAP
jgi:hypothetical protein